MGLREYQEEDLQKLRSCLKSGGRRVLFEASVGYGKSVVIEHLARSYSNAGKRVWVFSNRSAVVEQLNGRAGHLQNVTVTTVQAADRRRDRLAKNPADLVLVDEVHMGGAAAQYQRVLDCAPGAVAVGFTGTPRPETFEVFSAHVQGKGAAWLTENGFLSPLRYINPGKPDLSRIRVQNGDYATADLEKLMNRREICGDAIRSYREHCVGKPTLVFCCSVKHAEDTAAEFRAAGLACEVMTGKDKKEEVARKIRHIQDGGLLFSVDKVSAGFDLPDLHAIISLRPTKSPQLWVQQLGRVARAAPGKENGWVFDHCANWTRCGWLTEERNWREQETAKKPEAVTEDGEPLSIRRCESCFGLFETPATSCPFCGHENGQDTRISKAEKIRLDEMTEREMQEARQALRRKQKDEEKNAKTLQDFLKIAHVRGYSPGWAHKRFALRAGRSTPARSGFGLDGWPI